MWGAFLSGSRMRHAADRSVCLLGARSPVGREETQTAPWTAGQRKSGGAAGTGIRV